MDNKEFISDALRRRGIKDGHIIRAFYAVVRGDFVPKGYKGDAYVDELIQIYEILY